MLRSLNSSVAGMRNHQLRMDVIGNNIANVNTVAYKSSRLNFKDMFYQTLKSGSNVTNPSQVGLGMANKGIETVYTQGAITSTDLVTDLTIQGNGFFMVTSTPPGTDPSSVSITSGITPDDFSDDNIKLTRDGSFHINKDGYLVNSDGYYVLGDIDGTFTHINISGSTGITTSLDSIDSLGIDQEGNITGSYLDGGTPTPIENVQITLASFNNPESLVRIGNNLFEVSPAATSNSNVAAPGSDGMGVIISGSLEASNVDLANEFSNMIITQRGYQANSRVITVSDTLLEELINLKR